MDIHGSPFRLALGEHAVQTPALGEAAKMRHDVHPRLVLGDASQQELSQRLGGHADRHSTTKELTGQSGMSQMNVWKVRKPSE